MLSRSSVFTYHPSIQLPTLVTEYVIVRMWMSISRCSAEVKWDCLCTGGGWSIGPILVMGKAGKYGAKIEIRQGLMKLSRHMKRSLGALAVRAFGLQTGLQSDYSTRRTELVHDVTLGGRGGWLAGWANLFVLQAHLQACGASPQKRRQDSLAGRPIILPVFLLKTRPITFSATQYTGPSSKQRRGYACHGASDSLTTQNSLSI